jgi:hypothetical protein
VLIVTIQVTSSQWFVNLKPAVEDAVAVEGVGVGVDSPSEMSQDHYIARVVKLGPVRTSKETFTIGSGNKGKDGDMLRTSKEKLALYIGTNFGDDACQEWLSEKQLVLQEPTYPASVLARHAVREKAVTDRVTKMVSSLENQLVVIEAELLLTP